MAITAKGAGPPPIHGSRVGVSHCTGMKPAGYLSEQLGPEKFFFNNAGTRITFPNGKMKVNAFEKYNV